VVFLNDPTMQSLRTSSDSLMISNTGLLTLLQKTAFTSLALATVRPFPGNYDDTNKKLTEKDTIELIRHSPPLRDLHVSRCADAILFELKGKFAISYYSLGMAD